MNMIHHLDNVSVAIVQSDRVENFSDFTTGLLSYPNSLYHVAMCSCNGGGRWTGGSSSRKILFCFSSGFPTTLKAFSCGPVFQSCYTILSLKLCFLSQSLFLILLIFHASNCSFPSNSSISRFSPLWNTVQVSSFKEVCLLQSLKPSCNWLNSFNPLLFSLQSNAPFPVFFFSQNSQFIFPNFLWRNFLLVPFCNIYFSFSVSFSTNLARPFLKCIYYYNALQHNPTMLSQTYFALGF